MEQATHVFLIDDDPVVNFLHAKTLAKAGIKHTAAFERATDALELFRDSPVNGSAEERIIFLDINMPVMDGWEFLDDFRKLPADITSHYRVVIISSSIDPKDVERSKSYEVSKFVSKPLTEEKIQDIFSKQEQ